MSDSEAHPDDRVVPKLCGADIELGNMIVGDPMDRSFSTSGDAARALWNATRQAAVVTCGADGCWYVGGDDPQVPRHQQAIRVTVVDTTGCGDVFHGAYAAALARGLDLPDRVRLASAAAALKATRRGGQAGIPTKAAVDRFLEEYRE